MMIKGSTNFRELVDYLSALGHDLGYLNYHIVVTEQHLGVNLRDRFVIHHMQPE